MSAASDHIQRRGRGRLLIIILKRPHEATTKQPLEQTKRPQSYFSNIRSDTGKKGERERERDRQKGRDNCWASVLID